MHKNILFGMKIAIIGGGVAGLTAGIYAQKNGFESEIHERHTIVGGQCTGWYRKHFLLDNCVHWLTGTNPEKDIYKVWCDVGVLGDGVEIIQHESFMRIELGDTSIDFWYDLDHLRADLLALSPDDKDEIENFIKIVNAYRAVAMPALKPMEQHNLLDYWRLIKKMRRLGPIHRKYSKISINDYAARFKHPLLQKLITSYMPKSYNIASLFYVFGTFVDGNGALPRGGSLGMIERMKQKYESLGGKIITNHEAEKIDISFHKARAIHFKNGDTVTADYIICACDTDITFNHLIGKGLMDKFFLEHYHKHKEHPLYSSFNCYFAVDEVCQMPSTTISFECAPYTVHNDTHASVFVKNFDYEPSFSPEGKSVLQTMLVQYEDDFDYWKQLYETDHAAYKAEKMRIAGEIMERIAARFPELAGKLSILDVVTPMTYYRFCGAYKGAYMSFILTPYAPKATHRGILPGIRNLYLAGQWLQPPGGLPSAAVTGRFAIQRICKRAHIKFRD